MAVLPAPAAAPRWSISADAVAIVVPIATAATGVSLLLLSVRPGGAHPHHLTMLVGMTLAMMSPYAVPLGRAVARATLWWQAPAAVISAVLSFLAVWCAVSAVLHLVGELLSVTVSHLGAIAGTALFCAFAQLQLRRAALLRACQVTHPVRPAHPIRGASRWAALAAGQCVRVCAGPMTLMALTPSLVGFAAVTALLWIERFAGRPQLRFPLAVGYLLVGAGMIGTADASAPMGMPMPMPPPMPGHH